MKRCVILHGWAGHPDKGWKPWLKAELEARGWQVLAPQFPHANTPSRDEWLQVLAEVVGAPDEDTYFIGHSLGCFTFLKYIEQLPADTLIGGGVMVAGFAGHLKHPIPVLEKFYEDGLDWTAIRSHGGRYVALYSERDDYVRVESATEFETQLGAKLVKNNDWEHFSASEGITELPDALSAVLEMSTEV
jgi:predicted alpha/beta hydrolase family esterase